MRTYRDPTGSPLLTWLSTTNFRIRRWRSSSLGWVMGLGVVGTRDLQVPTPRGRYQPGPRVSSGRGNSGKGPALRACVGPREQLRGKIVREDRKSVVEGE